MRHALLFACLAGCLAPVDEDALDGAPLSLSIACTTERVRPDLRTEGVIQSAQIRWRVDSQGAGWTETVELVESDVRDRWEAELSRVGDQAEHVDGETTLLQCSEADASVLTFEVLVIDGLTEERCAAGGDWVDADCPNSLEL